MRLTKAIRFREGVSLNLVVEGFNIFNIANLGGGAGFSTSPYYNATVNNPDFGQPGDRTAQVFGTGGPGTGGPRAFQISARLRF